jgi:CubicO group peptidase (beta-lactamase class C family)
MRVMSRERNSRSEFIRRCGWVALSATSLLALAACGGGGGGGGNDQPSAPVNPPPPPPPPPPAGNNTPTAQAGTDQTIEWPVATAQLTGTGTDADTGQTLTYTWSGPSGVTFSAANAASTNVTFPSAGSYTLTLAVSDGSASATDTVAVTVSPAVYPASDISNDQPEHGWTRVAAADIGMNDTALGEAEAYALTGGGSGMIVRRGRLVRSWGNTEQRFDMKSTTKSIGGIALGLAIDGNAVALTDVAQTRLPTVGNPTANHPEWLPQITVQQLATHTAGFAKPGGYVDQLYQPGTTWFYSDAGLNWLAELLTTVLAEDLATRLNTRVWATLGLNSTAGGTQNSDGPALSDIHWRDNVLRPGTTPRELASGIYANANAMARVGLLFLRKGQWADTRVLSESFVTTVATPPAANAGLTIQDPANFPGATTNYGVLWWTNAGGLLPNVPRDAFWAWGLGDSLIVVIPSLDIVAVRAGPQAAVGSSPGARVWNDDDWNGDYAVLAPFLDPIVRSVTP